MNIGKMDNSIVFVMCVLMLAFATLCQHNLIQMTTGSKTSQAEALKEINEIGETWFFIFVFLIWPATILGNTFFFLHFITIDSLRLHVDL